MSPPKKITLWMTSLLLVGACGDNVAGTSVDETQPALAARLDKTPTPTVPATEAPIQEPIQRLTGMVNADAGGGDLIIEMHPKSAVTGTMQLGTRHLQLHGTRRNDKLQCWISVDDGKDPLRGTLLGERRDKGFAGTFIVSGSGGEKTIHGSWSAETTNDL